MKSLHPALYFTLILLGGCLPVREVVRSVPAPQPLTSNAAPLLKPGDLNYVTQVVQRVGPAVVRIDSSRSVRQSRWRDPSQPGSNVSPYGRVQRGMGSGFIISSNGQVLTNAHVVADADRVTVILKDGRRLRGEVIGVDKVTDVAVVKVQATGLPTVRLGNSDQLLPGQWAIAIGNPLGLNNTVTQGIISATGRSSADVGAPTERVDFIQTDAAINPGNSGGPLLNAEGEVIGMNSAIIQGAQGLGFAIPINTAKRIAEALVTQGRVEHPYIGVTMSELNAELQETINHSDLGFRLDRDRGVVILKVAPNSPAERAGLQSGDIIESINGQRIATAQQVQQQVEATGLENALQLKINRSGQPRQVSLKPTPLPN
uniref:2-alkenal reductase n=1 Tax=Cyanothece sp. (strain PCC 7425 / ATCC 29141) TaxID=395961 RepID=B8HVW1_CYAP4